MTFNWTIDHHACVESTQTLLKEKAKGGAQEGCVVSAEKQTAGRGRQGKVWIAPEGNLSMSFLLRPHCSPAQAGQYSFLVAVALSKTLDKYIEKGHVKHLKWPNDILIDGQKCAGILLESDLSDEGKIEALYIGVGVNILHAPPERCALQEVSSQEVSASLLLAKFLENIKKYINLYKENGFLSIREIWMEEAYKLKEEIKVRLPDKTLTGVFEGLDEDGALLLRLDNGVLERVSAGEVYF